MRVYPIANSPFPFFIFGERINREPMGFAQETIGRLMLHLLLYSRHFHSSHLAGLERAARRDEPILASVGAPAPEETGSHHATAPGEQIDCCPSRRRRRETASTRRQVTDFRDSGAAETKTRLATARRGLRHFIIRSRVCSFIKRFICSPAGDKRVKRSTLGRSAGFPLLVVAFLRNNSTRETKKDEGREENTRARNVVSVTLGSPA